MRPGIGRALARLSGILLLIVPFLSLPDLLGPFPDSKGLTHPGEWALGSAIVLMIACILPVQIPQALEKLFARLIGNSFLPLIAVDLLATLLVFIAWSVFNLSPLLIDEAAQFFQAKIFAAGHLTAQTPRLPEFFFMQQMLFDGSRLYSQYPPGHTAALALGVLAGAAWIIGPALTVLTAVFLYQFSSLVYGEVTARRTLLLALCCPFLLFLGASYMNHISALCGLCLALWSCARWEKDRRNGALFWAGLGVGYAILARPLCGIAGGAVIGVWIVPEMIRRREFEALLFGAFPGAICLLLLAFYNEQTTGSVFLPGYLKLWGESHGLGFHRTPWGDEHTPLSGFKNLLINLSMLQEYIFETPIPGLIGVSAAALLANRSEAVKDRWDRRLLAFFWAFPVIYLFYWHRDSYLGPRFVSASLLAALPLTVRGIELICLWAQEKSVLGYAVRPRIVSAATLALLYTLCGGIPGRFAIYRSDLGSMKEARTQEKSWHGAQMNGTKGLKSPRLIFIPVSWGSRIISVLRTHGASAAVMEESYHLADHCSLQELADQALAGSVIPANIDGELRALQQDHAPRVQVSADPSVRLLPGRPLSQRCREEIERDQAGFTLSLPYLILNNPDWSGENIFVTDLEDHDRDLIALYPDRAPYRLGRSGLEPL